MKGMQNIYTWNTSKLISTININKMYQTYEQFHFWNQYINTWQH